MQKKLQIFVSSTFTDLKPERQAAVSAILKSGHIPAGMELFTAGDKSQMDTIKRWIRESDVYMLILGGRYGSIEQTTSLSYTELEYDFAKEIGKPIFAVVIEESAIEQKVKLHGRACLETENPKELKLFREKVLANVSSFFHDEKDIKLCVYESLSELSTDENLVGWIRSDEVISSAKLEEQVEFLLKENNTLKEQVDKEKSDNIPNFDDLYKVLKSVTITIPENLRSDEASSEEMTLLAAFYNHKEHLISGISNSYGMDDASRFFYYNIFPKLQMYELADNEKVAGVKYRRSFVTKKGLAFLAEVEKRKYNKKDSLNLDE